MKESTILQILQKTLKGKKVYPSNPYNKKLCVKDGYMIVNEVNYLTGHEQNGYSFSHEWITINLNVQYTTVTNETKTINITEDIELIRFSSL